MFLKIIWNFGKYGYLCNLYEYFYHGCFCELGHLPHANVRKRGEVDMLRGSNNII